MHLNLKKIIISGLGVLILQFALNHKTISSVILNAAAIEQDTIKAIIQKDSIRKLLDDYCSVLKNIDILAVKIKKNEGQLNDLLTRKEMIWKFYSADIWKILTADSSADIFDKAKRLKMQADFLLDSLDKISTNCENLRLEINKSSREKEILSKSSRLKLDSIQTLTGKLAESQSIYYKNVEYELFITDLDSFDIRMHLYNSLGKNYYSPKALLNELERNKSHVMMITNAGMYTANYKPKGLYIENGKQIVKLDTISKIKSDANFYLRPNGVFYIDSNNVAHVITTAAYYAGSDRNDLKVSYATQSGPMLSIKGVINPVFKYGSTNKNIRSGVGIMENGNVVFAISRDMVNFYDFATFFRDIFNCKDALYLDGAISEMYLSDLAPEHTGGQFGPMISVIKKQ
jgi:uncharacterized protein YigE (DUF2233 family)